MKKPKNKFILIVIWFIVSIIFFQVYVAFSHKNVDTNSYFTLIEWRATLNDDFVETQQRLLLQTGDTVRVIWDSWLALIEWWDGSLTRLGGNTKIIVEQNQISRDYSTINISFQLIAGKTWSNVVSFIWKDSSFTQSFDGVEAWVRWTVFDVDLDQDYVHVSDHEVELSLENGASITLWEWDALDITSFSLIDLENFINNIQDTAWAELNKQFDNEYFDILKQSLQSSLDSANPLAFITPFTSKKFQLTQALAQSDDYAKIQEILDTVSISEKDELYVAVLTKYQNINFISARDYEFYKRKVFYQKALAYLWSEEDTQVLVRSSIYDLQDMLQVGDVSAMSDTLWFLSEHKDLLPEVDSSFLSDSLSWIPKGLQREFLDQLENFDFGGFLDISIPDTSNIDIWDIWERAIEGIQSIDSNVQDFVGDAAGSLFEQFAR